MPEQSLPEGVRVYRAFGRAPRPEPLQTWHTAVGTDLVEINDLPKIIEQAYQEAMERMREAAQRCPRWTGGYIAAHERDGEYVEVSVLQAALDVFGEQGGEGRCPDCGWTWKEPEEEMHIRNCPKVASDDA